MELRLSCTNPSISDKDIHHSWDQYLFQTKDGGLKLLQVLNLHQSLPWQPGPNTLESTIELKTIFTYRPLIHLVFINGFKAKLETYLYSKAYEYPTCVLSYFMHRPRMPAGFWA